MKNLFLIKLKVFALEFFLGKVTLIKNAYLSFLKIIFFYFLYFLNKNLSTFDLGNFA